MQIGTHTRDVTPPLGTYLGGYARLLNAKGIRDRLQAGVAAFEDTDGGCAIVVTLDLVFAHYAFCERLRASIRQAIDRPDAAVLVSCSHSHSTPYGTHEAPDARFQNYADHLLEQATEVAATAWAEREPARIEFRRAPVDIAVNRRLPNADGTVDFGWNEEGPRDHHARVLTLRTVDGRTLATIVNFACHPICLPPWSRDVSGDWVGEMRQAMQAELGAPCLFMQGAAADVSPRHEWITGRFGKPNPNNPPAAPSNSEACTVLGQRIAADVIAACAQPGETVDDGPIRVLHSDVPLPIQPEMGPRGPLPYWHGMIRKPKLPRWIVDALLRRAFPWKIRQEQHQEGLYVTLAVQAVRIGGLAIAAHGSETFNATGAAVIDAAPTPHCLFAGYANDMVGYVPPPEDIPFGGYEVNEAPYLYRLPGRFDDRGEPAARAETIAMVQALFSTTPDPNNT